MSDRPEGSQGRLGAGDAHLEGQRRRQQAYLEELLLLQQRLPEDAGQIRNIELDIIEGYHYYEMRADIK